MYMPPFNINITGQLSYKYFYHSLLKMQREKEKGLMSCTEMGKLQASAAVCNKCLLFWK